MIMESCVRHHNYYATMQRTMSRDPNLVFAYRSDYSSLADGVPQPGSRDPAAGLGRNPPVRYTTQTFPHFYIPSSFPILIFFTVIFSIIFFHYF